jgi:hypothetical protein
MNVAQYYDDNTRRFLKTGTGAGEDAIHRPVWAPGIAGRLQAVHYVEDEIIKSARRGGSKALIDLGCGVGATMRYMHAQYPAEYRGLTISTVQHGIGDAKLAGTAGCTISLGDMADRRTLASIRSGLHSPVTAFCIESFLHVPDGLGFINTLGSVLHDGDSFFLCDDFLAVEVADERSQRIVETFQKGWHAPSLLAPMAVIHAAAGAGLELVSNTDLTPFLKLGRIQNRAIAILVALLHPFRLSSAWWDNFAGGNALQKGLTKGLIEYRLVQFKKR